MNTTLNKLDKKEVSNTKKKTTLTEQEYNTNLQAQIDSRILGYMRAGKKVTPQVEAQIKTKVESVFSSEYRVKHMRGGLIESAPIEIKNRLLEIKSELEKLGWNNIKVGLLLKNKTDEK